MYDWCNYNHNTLASLHSVDRGDLDFTKYTVWGKKYTYIHISPSCFLNVINCGGAPQKERGSETSVSKAEGSQGEVSLLSANPAPRQARDNQTSQGFRRSSSALLPQTLDLYSQARGFCEGWTNHVKGQIVICHSCTNHVKGQVVMRFIVTRVYGDCGLSTCTEIKRANQKFWQKTYPTPSSRLPGSIKASPSLSRFPI